MKKNIKIIKKVVLIILILILPIFYTPSVYATNNYFDDVIKEGDSFIENGKNHNDNIGDKQKIKTTIDVIYNTLLIAGTAVAVIVGVILGIKYMTESVEEQAKIKETLIIYGVGCLVAFGAFGIWKVAITVLKQL